MRVICLALYISSNLTLLICFLRDKQSSKEEVTGTITSDEGDKTSDDDAR
jgi:hypothetical protein